MHEPDRRQAGFFEPTPRRALFIAGAGAAAAIFFGYVKKAFRAGDKLDDALNPPLPPPAPPPPVNPAVALREAAAALDKAERTAADRTAKAGAAEWQVAQAEVHLRGLDGRPLGGPGRRDRAGAADGARRGRPRDSRRGRPLNGRIPGAVPHERDENCPSPSGRPLHVPDHRPTGRLG